jgi:hypothetical protein
MLYIHKHVYTLKKKNIFIITKPSNFSQFQQFMHRFCRQFYVFCIVCCFVGFSEAFAWGEAGHKTVAAIADQLIEHSNASRQVNTLLLQGESLVKISIWADCIKGKSCNAKPEEILAYIATNPKHADYHYTDIPFQINTYQDGGVGTHDSDIVQILKQAISVLQGKAEMMNNPHQFTPRQALFLLVHLIGDLHQPLHVGVGYVGDDGLFVVPENTLLIDGRSINNTYGGNALLLSENLRPTRPPKGNPNSLHAYWDTTVIENAMYRLHAKSPVEFAKLLLELNHETTINVGNPILWPYEWAKDTLAISKLAHAGLEIKNTMQLTGRNGDIFSAWIVSLPEGYAQRSSSIAEHQIIKSGYRLAALLKAIWP